MAGVFEYFEKKKFLLCVDSDGCAMDTMDIKHKKCFGPCLIEEWGLGEWWEVILSRWNEINLYSMSRGINRFKGLAQILHEIQENHTNIEDLDAYETWVRNSTELSNQSLKEEIQRNHAVCLKKNLSWSEKVNGQITLLEDDEKKPFPGVAETLKKVHEYADIAIVSSANLQAVLEEWDMHGLLEYTDIVLAQDVGSKQYCIARLLEYGYEKEQVLMAGDAPGDLDAAAANEVLYFPILVKSEAESWKELGGSALEAFLNGTYAGKYQEDKICEFKEKLIKGQEE